MYISISAVVIFVLDIFYSLKHIRKSQYIHKIVDYTYCQLDTVRNINRSLHTSMSQHLCTIYSMVGNKSQMSISQANNF